jgi:carbonic anhydrase/acetyltransferase-like protein (isoleucine patch superfamily)
MNLYPYRDKRPRIDPTAYLAPGARVIGDVEIGPRSSIWFNAVIRADSAPVRIGTETNVQDGAILHVDPDAPCFVGDVSTIGHGAIVHGCTIGRSCLIGMGSVVLSGAVIGDESIVAAGALIPEGRAYPERSLLVGSPARRLRDLSDEDVARLIQPGAQHYVDFAVEYRSLGPSG